MFDPDTWQKARIIDRREWDDGLFTARLDVVRYFKAGQFATLGLEVDGEPIKRAYSLSSSPGSNLEVYVIEVEDGQLSPRLWRLAVGDEIWLRDKIAGLFTLDRVEPGGTLWLVATGTGLAPYVSMLRHRMVFELFERVVVVHGARTGPQLGYRDELERFVASHGLVYVPATTRAEVEGALHGRITDLFESGALEEAVGAELAGEGHQVMLCGNPAMVDDMRGLLEARDLSLWLPKRPGQIHIERYW